MNVEITGRHIEITEPIRKFTTDRVERLRGIGEEIMEVHFILTVEKHQCHIAEVDMKTRHERLHGEEMSSDMYTSIAAVLDKIEKQILKSKGKAHGRKRRHGDGIVQTDSVGEVEAALGEQLPRIVRTNEMAAKPMNVDDVAVAVGDSDADCPVFRNSASDCLNVVYKRKDGNIGWIELEA